MEIAGNPVQTQTKKYKNEYQPKEKKSWVSINVDDELAEIIRSMKKDPGTDKAIRGYAKAYLGMD
jgi:hypothetical protein